MITPQWPIEGGCRCGRVRFRLAAPPQMEMACHCRGCQRLFDDDDPGRARSCALAGETEIGGIRGDQGHHHHCSWCKSWIYTEAVAQPESLNVRATLLDDPYWFAPWAETQTAEKLPRARTGALRSVARFPEAREIAMLGADYPAARSWPDRPTAS